MTNAALARHWFMHSRHTAIGMGGNRPAQLSPPPDVRLAPSERLLHVGVFAGCEAGMETAAERLVLHFNRHPQMIAVRPWRETAAYAAPDLPPVPVAEHAWGHAAHDDTCDDYDCLVLLGWPAADDRRRLKQIELYCRDDRPVVALRTLDAEMPGWADFCEEVFGGRLGKKGDSPNLPTHCAGAPRPVAQMGTVPLFPQRPTRLLEVLRSEVAWHHPVVDGVEIMIAEGEVYRGPRLSPRATVLLTADDGRGPAPVAWAMRRGGGRTVCSTLGQEDDFREPAFLRLLSNAVRWAAMA